LETGSLIFLQLTADQQKEVKRGIFTQKAVKKEFLHQKDACKSK